MESQGITRESEIKKFNSRVLEEVHSVPLGAIKGQDSVWAEGVGQDLGHMLLLNSTGEVLCGSWAKSRLVNSDQKNQVLVSFLEVLQEVPKGKILGGRKKCLSQGSWQSHIRNFNTPVVHWWGWCQFQAPARCLIIPTGCQGSNIMESSS